MYVDMHLPQLFLPSLKEAEIKTMLFEPTRATKTEHMMLSFDSFKSTSCSYLYYYLTVSGAKI